VETVRQLPQQPASSGTAERLSKAAQSSGGERAALADASILRLQKPVEARFQLQRRAPANLRRHFRRVAVRFVVLAVADLASFGVMRQLVRAFRDGEVLGPGVATWLQGVLSAGILNGWQYAGALFIGLVLMRNYGARDRRRDPSRLFAACALATALPLWNALWTLGVGHVLLQYSLTVVLVWLGLVGERLTIDRIVARVHPPERDALQTLFVGPVGDCLELADTRAFAVGAEFRPIGFVDVQIPPAPGSLGHVSEFPLLLAASGAQVVALCGYLTHKQFQDVVDAGLAAGCQVLAVPRAAEIAGVHPTTVWRSGQPLVQLSAPSLKGPQLILKHALDFIGAAAGLLLFSPLFAVLAVLIKLDSRGPVFFTQERVGKGGLRFNIIKFRTMVDGAEAKRDELLSKSVYGDQRLFKVPGDPRVTRLGRWLRRTSLDELPQLLNVLRGEMALVGPRPPLRSEVLLYEAHHYARFDVKPGMTGPWQVAGRNQVTDFERVVSLESTYIREWSLFRDIGILLQTVPAVLGMRGAH
jgi:exopolysaccharide biosynthesis polyprenyl glycosylphosphotransferase